MTPVMYSDITGYAWWNPFSWSNSTKIIVGVAIIAALGIATVLTGGAAAGVAGFILSGAFQGALAGALTGAVGGALVGAATGFMTGAFFGGIGGAVGRLTTLSKWDPGTFGSKYDSMLYHFETHGIQSGSNFWGNNMVNYTNDAVNFSLRNASALKYTYNYNYGNASWNINYLYGNGGQYTSLGKIITFWYL
jgi:hypothetical protein